MDTLTKFKKRLVQWYAADAGAHLDIAERAGLMPIKLNTVVIRQVNDDELSDIARLTQHHPWHVRFIELMPVGNLGDWGERFPPVGERYFSMQEMLARTFRIPGALGTVGFISPLGEHFCATCNRLRLTADGRLCPCLLMEDEVPVRGALRQRMDVTPLIEQAVTLKPRGHNLLISYALAPQSRRMCQIGG